VPTPTERMLLIRFLATGCGTGGFAHGLGERDEIVVRRWGRPILALVPYQVPTPRRGQPAGV